MRDLKKYTVECMEELDKLNITYNNVIDVSENSRAKHRWGQCRRVPGGFTININSMLLDERVPEKHLKETLMHELLHTCDGCFNHGEKWKYLAALIGRKYGYEVSRAVSYADMGIAEEITEKQPKYAVHCTRCGQTIYRYRKSDLIQNPEEYTCGICGGKFERMELDHVC